MKNFADTEADFLTKNYMVTEHIVSVGLSDEVMFTFKLKNILIGFHTITYLEEKTIFKISAPFEAIIPIKHRSLFLSNDQNKEQISSAYKPSALYNILHTDFTYKIQSIKNILVLIFPAYTISLPDNLSIEDLLAKPNNNIKFLITLTPGKMPGKSPFTAFSMPEGMEEYTLPGWVIYDRNKITFKFDKIHDALIKYVPATSNTLLSTYNKREIAQEHPKHDDKKIKLLREDSIPVIS